MNKDEMVKDLKRDYKLCVTCEMFNGWVDESGNIHDAGCLEYLNCDCNATDVLAKILINEGYRKVADDEIVIKKSEYEALKKDKNDYKQRFESSDKRYGQLVRTSVEALEKCETKCKKIGDVVKQETAKAFWYMVATQIKDTVEPLPNAKDTSFADGVAQARRRVLRILDETLKQFGVEVGE